MVVGVSKAELLRRAERTTLARRASAIQELCDALEWCDLNSTDPQARPSARPISQGGDHLTRYGGEGTPDVSELCAGELAIARQAGVAATQNLMADALDLAYRLPRVWARGQELVCEAWVERKIAVLARRLTRAQCAVLDEALVDALEQAPGKVLRLAETRVIEIDPTGTTPG